MALTITSEQRDALYDRILDRLSGIGDIRVSVEAGDYDTADRLACEFSDELRFVSEDLHWGAGTDASEVELRTAPDALLRLFSRWRDSAASERGAKAPEWAECRGREDRNRLVGEVSANILRGLEGAR